AFLFFAGALGLLAGTADARAQWPGEVRGDVIDVLSGRPVPSAEVRVFGAAAAAVPGAAGAFGMRALEPGAGRLGVRAPGYSTLEREIMVANGAVTTVRLELAPDAMDLEGVVATVDAAPDGARTLSGAALRALAATTLGEVVATVPGVRIESRVRGSSEIPSIRGS